MKEWIDDLDNDVIVHRIGLYSIKRYKYRGNDYYVDKEGKPIKEPLYSFILMRGPKWFNNTHNYFHEKDFDKVVPAYEKIVLEMTNERREKLTLERTIRKQFPIKHEFVFKNVTITAIEKPCYYYQGIPSTSGSYFEPKEKIVQFYANGRPYRNSKHTNLNTTVDVDFIIDNTIRNSILHHYSKEKFDKQYAKTIKTKLKYAYTPLVAIVGYVYEFNKQQYEIYDFGSSLFRDISYFKIQNQQELEVRLSDFMSSAKIVGELQGVKAWTALLNKTKFIND